MKKISLFLILCMFVLNFPLLTVEAGDKGASEKAMENASEDAVFHRMGDWFATVGKSDEEKAAIKAERREKRRLKREKKKAEKEAKRAEKEAKKALKEGDKKAKKAGKKGKKGLGKLKDKIKKE